MEVTYDMQPADLVQFRRFWWVKKSPVKPWMIIMGLVLLLAISYSPWLGNWRSSAFSFCLPLVAIMLLFMPLEPLSAAQQAKATPGFVGLQTMAISPTGLTRKTTVTETKVQWQSVVDDTEDAKQIYIFLNPRSAFMIPERGFTHREDAQAFLQAARDYWKNPGQPLPAASESNGAWPPPPRTLKS